MPAGAMLQVVQTVKTDTFSSNPSSAWIDITGLSVSITPLSSSSKILVQISIVGGGHGLYGDGVKTFEMYDFRESDVQGYLSVDEINMHLAKNPIG